MIVDGRKFCTKCQTEKSVGDFYKSVHAKDGLQTHCKLCNKLAHRQWELANRDKKNAIQKRFYKKNKDRINAKVREEYRKDVEKSRAKNRELRKKFGDRIRASSIRWKKANRDKVYTSDRKYRLANPQKVSRWKKISYMRERDDPVLRYIQFTRTIITQVLRGKQLTKRKRNEEILGCSLDEMRKHIASQFLSNMTWENYGKVWSIDHIEPLCAAVTIEDVNRLNNYRNLRPIYIQENHHKKRNDLKKAYRTSHFRGSRNERLRSGEILK